MTWETVINGESRYSVEAADCIAWCEQLPEDSVDLFFFSPPYEAARTYGIDFNLKGQDWVNWMVKVFVAARRACKGLVACVCEGRTKNYAYTASPFLLVADLHRAGFYLRKPPVFHRVGIPGSGGPDWLRNDWELIVCTTKGGKLPWSNNTACGHIPKYAPGGEMSNRVTDGTRVNQWGTYIDKDGMVGKGGQKGASGVRAGRVPAPPSHKFASMTSRGVDGDRKVAGGRRVTRGHDNGDTATSDSYDPPALANPGNVISCKVGGGLMGHKIAHENEAPFPLSLAEFFVRSFAPPNGIVADFFSGSGTTMHAAIKWGRRFVGADIRQSQVELAYRRAMSVQPVLSDDV